MRHDNKLDLVISSLLSRLTDFELQTKDDEFMHRLEELRELIVKFGGKDE